MIGTQEIIIILAIALLLFGGKKLPDIGKGLGKALREFKDTQKEVRDAFDLKGEVTDGKQKDAPPSKPAPENKSETEKSDDTKDPAH